MKKVTLIFAILFAAGLNSSRAQGTWTQKADFGGTGREAAVGFSIGSKGYIGTGIGTGGGYQKDFWEYDPTTNIWTQKADFGGTGRAWAVGFSIGTRGYIGTGYGNNNSSNDFWEYDPVTNIWTKKTDFGGTARSSAVGFSIGSKGYIGTGFDENNFYQNDFWEYDPATNIWTQKANYGGGNNSEAAGFSIGGKGYVGTGYYGGTSRKDFWEYDPANDTWAQKTDFGGTARYGVVAFSINSKGYMGTGLDPTGRTNDFWEYDPATNGWTQKADFGGTAREYASEFALGSKGYLGTGGANEGLKNDFWEYTPVCNGLTVFADDDDDLYGDAVNSFFAVDCVAPDGYVYDNTDCNDANAAIHPGVIDICNGIDDNCNGTIDESCGNTITTGSISGSPFCPEAIVSVPFISSGTFVSGNIYSAQLSDKMGNFSAPTTIGTLSSTGNSGTIAATIPSKPKPGSKYRIRVTSNIPIVTGTNNGHNMKLNACGTVTALSASGITATAATLNWTGVFCAAKYRVEYRKQGTTSWTKPFSSINSYVITGLVANTTYEYRIQTYCSQSGSSSSGFTSIQTFTTTLRLSSGSGSVEEMMSIYPNPAEDHATIQFSLPQSSHVSIRVYDVSGKEVETLLNDDVQQGEHSLQINTAHFPKGVYLVRMISDSGIENQKLIVQ